MQDDTCSVTLASLATQAQHSGVDAFVLCGLIMSRVDPAQVKLCVSPPRPTSYWLSIHGRRYDFRRGPALLGQAECVDRLRSLPPHGEIRLVSFDPTAQTMLCFTETDGTFLAAMQLLPPTLEYQTEQQSETDES